MLDDHFLIWCYKIGYRRIPQYLLQWSREVSEEENHLEMRFRISAQSLRPGHFERNSQLSKNRIRPGETSAVSIYWCKICGYLLTERAQDIWIDIYNDLNGWESVGCWRDLPFRAIATLEGKSKQLSRVWKTRSDPLTSCAKAAAEQNLKVFAIQNGGQCFGGPYAQYFFDQYGPSNLCKNGLGGTWSNNVYSSKMAYERVLKEEKADEKVTKCMKPLDLVFLIDGSGQPSLENNFRWDEMLKFISKMTEKFNTDSTRFGVVGYGATPKIIVNMTDNQDVNAIQKQLMEEKFPGGKRTINDAMKTAWKDLFKPSKRSGNRVILALTSGNVPYGPWGSTLFLSKKNVRVMAFGIDKSPKYGYLESLASWKRPENIYSLDMNQLMTAVPFVTKDLCTGAKKDEMQTEDDRNELNEFETVGSALERQSEETTAAKNDVKPGEEEFISKSQEGEQKNSETKTQGSKERPSSQSETTGSLKAKTQDYGISDGEIVEKLKVDAASKLKSTSGKEERLKIVETNHEPLSGVDTFMKTGTAMERNPTEKSAQNGKEKTSEELQVDKAKSKTDAKATAKTNKTLHSRYSPSFEKGRVSEEKESQEQGSGRPMTESRSENKPSQMSSSKLNATKTKEASTPIRKVHEKPSKLDIGTPYFPESEERPVMNGNEQIEAHARGSATAQNHTAVKATPVKATPVKETQQGKDASMQTEKTSTYANTGANHGQLAAAEDNRGRYFAGREKQQQYSSYDNAMPTTSAQAPAQYSTTNSQLTTPTTEKESYAAPNAQAMSQVTEKQASYAVPPQWQYPAYENQAPLATAVNGQAQSLMENYQAPSFEAPNERQGFYAVNERQGQYSTVTERQRSSYDNGNSERQVQFATTPEQQSSSYATNESKAGYVTPEKQTVDFAPINNSNNSLQENRNASSALTQFSADATENKQTQVSRNDSTTRAAKEEARPKEIEKVKTTDDSDVASESKKEVNKSLPVSKVEKFSPVRNDTAKDFDKELFANIEKERDSFGDDDTDDATNTKDDADRVETKDEKFSEDEAALPTDDSYDPLTTTGDAATERALQQKRKEIDSLLRKLGENKRRKHNSRQRRKIRLSKFIHPEDPTMHTHVSYHNGKAGKRGFSNENRAGDSESDEMLQGQATGFESFDRSDEQVNNDITRHIHRISANDSKPLPIGRPIVPTKGASAVLNNLFKPGSEAANVKVNYDIFDPVFSSKHSKNLTKVEFDKLMTRLKTKSDNQLTLNQSTDTENSFANEYLTDHQQFFLRHKIDHEASTASKPDRNAKVKKPDVTKSGSRLTGNVKHFNRQPISSHQQQQQKEKALLSSVTHHPFSKQVVRTNARVEYKPMSDREEEPISRTVHFPVVVGDKRSGGLSEFDFAPLPDVDTGSYSIKKVSRNKILVTLKSKNGELQTFYGTTTGPSKSKKKKSKKRPSAGKSHAGIEPIQVIPERKGFSNAIKAPEIAKNGAPHNAEKSSKTTVRYDSALSSKKGLKTSMKTTSKDGSKSTVFSKNNKKLKNYSEKEFRKESQEDSKKESEKVSKKKSQKAFQKESQKWSQRGSKKEFHSDSQDVSKEGSKKISKKESQTKSKKNIQKGSQKESDKEFYVESQGEFKETPEKISIKDSEKESHKKKQRESQKGSEKEFSTESQEDSKKASENISKKESQGESQKESQGESQKGSQGESQKGSQRESQKESQGESQKESQKEKQRESKTVSSTKKHDSPSGHTKNKKETAYDLFDNRLVHVDKPINYFTKPHDRLIITENDDPLSDSRMIKLFFNSGNDESTLSSQDAVRLKKPESGSSQLLPIVDSDDHLPMKEVADTRSKLKNVSHDAKESRELHKSKGQDWKSFEKSDFDDLGFDEYGGELKQKGYSEEKDSGSLLPNRRNFKELEEDEQPSSNSQNDEEGKKMKSSSAEKETKEEGNGSEKIESKEEKAKLDKAESAFNNAEKSSKNTDKEGAKGQQKTPGNKPSSFDKAENSLEKAEKENEKVQSPKVGDNKERSDEEFGGEDKEFIQGGSKADGRGNDSDKKGLEESQKELDKSGTQSQRIGQEADKSGKQSGQSGKESEQSEKESDKRKDSKSAGKESESSGKEIEHNTKNASSNFKQKSGKKKKRNQPQGNMAKAKRMTVVSKLQSDVGCHRPMKVMYVVDVSEGIGTGPARKKRWNHLKRFLSTVNGKIAQGGNAGYIVYDSEPRYISNLEPCDEMTEYFITSSECLCDTHSSAYRHGQTSCTTHAPTLDESLEDWGAQGPRTAKALQLARRHFKDDAVGGAKKLIVLLTHQSSTDDVTATEKDLKNDGISLVDIEVGERHNLKKRSAVLDDVIPRDHQLQVSFYKLDKAIENIVKKICAEKSSTKRRETVLISLGHNAKNMSMTNFVEYSEKRSERDAESHATFVAISRHAHTLNMDAAGTCRPLPKAIMEKAVQELPDHHPVAHSPDLDVAGMVPRPLMNFIQIVQFAEIS
eukprot:gene14144-15622_t